MNINYTWLRELVASRLSAAEVADRLTGVGFAVEGFSEVNGDVILDIDVTSNRPDGLSHLGIAREVSAICGVALISEANVEPIDQAAPLPSILASDVVKLQDIDLCHRFTGRIIRNVKVGPSPEWLRHRLESVGERSINNVADITNYVMLELGQPMHAFDLDRLAGRQIVVRRARPGEKIQTLDGVERTLTPDILAICDAEKPVAIAGVIGGLDSSISEGTTNVLLEVAYFDRASIRATSRRLNVTTEASYRFERGVDIENLIRASDRAAELISELAAGSPESVIDVYAHKREQITIAANDLSASVRRLTGLVVDDAECDRRIATLGIARIESGKYVVPSWRHDLSAEEDLVEEVARLIGYDKIGEEMPAACGSGEYQPAERRKRGARLALTQMGYNEAMNYSFISQDWDQRISFVSSLISESGGRFVTLRDSVIEGAVRMRASLLPGLAASVRLNLNQQQRGVKLFEFGKAFASSPAIDIPAADDGLPIERELFAVIAAGNEAIADSAAAGRQIDFYDLKGAVESAADALGIAGMKFEKASLLHLSPGQASSISIARARIGSIGRLNQEISDHFKFRMPVYFAEIDLQAALETPARAYSYQQLPRYPAIRRDVSFVVRRDLSFEQIRRETINLGTNLLRSVEFVDVFEGKGIGEDERSITISLEYRSDDRTLLEDEVNAVHASLLLSLESILGIRPRI